MPTVARFATPLACLVLGAQTRRLGMDRFGELAQELIPEQRIIGSFVNQSDQCVLRHTSNCLDSFLL